MLLKGKYTWRIWIDHVRNRKFNDGTVNWRKNRILFFFCCSVFVSIFDRLSVKYGLGDATTNSQAHCWCGAAGPAVDSPSTCASAWEAAKRGWMEIKQKWSRVWETNKYSFEFYFSAPEAIHFDQYPIWRSFGHKNAHRISTPFQSTAGATIPLFIPNK